MSKSPIRIDGVTTVPHVRRVPVPLRVERKTEAASVSSATYTPSRPKDRSEAGSEPLTYAHLKPKNFG